MGLHHLGPGKKRIEKPVFCHPPRGALVADQHEEKQASEHPAPSGSSIAVVRPITPGLAEAFDGSGYHDRGFSTSRPSSRFVERTVSQRVAIAEDFPVECHYTGQSIRNLLAAGDKNAVPPLTVPMEHLPYIATHICQLQE